jgi:hypothetical protein
VTNTIQKAVSADVSIFPLSSWYAEFVLEGLMRGAHSDRADFYTKMFALLDIRGSARSRWTRSGRGRTCRRRRGEAAGAAAPADADAIALTGTATGTARERLTPAQVAALAANVN